MGDSNVVLQDLTPNACDPECVPLADKLRTLPAVKGFTFTHVEGHSDHSADDPFLSARDKVVGYVPRVRVDVLLGNEEMGAVLDALKAQSDLSGQGVYWVTAVEQEGRL